MASVNKVILIGNLGKEPEGRVMPSGTAVTKFSLATNHKWKGKTGETETKTEWHNIVMYSKLAELGATLLKKGSSVYIEGSINTDKWKDKDGQDRTTYNIVASAMQILNGKDGVEAAHSDETAFKNIPQHPILKTTQHKVQNAELFADDDLPF